MRICEALDAAAPLYAGHGRPSVCNVCSSQRALLLLGVRAITVSIAGKRQEVFFSGFATFPQYSFASVSLIRKVTWRGQLAVWFLRR